MKSYFGFSRSSKSPSSVPVSSSPSLPHIGPKKSGAASAAKEKEVSPILSLQNWADQAHLASLLPASLAQQFSNSLHHSQSSSQLKSPTAQPAAAKAPTKLHTQSASTLPSLVPSSVSSPPPSSGSLVRSPVTVPVPEPSFGVLAHERIADSAAAAERLKLKQSPSHRRDNHSTDLSVTAAAINGSAGFAAASVKSHQRIQTHSSTSHYRMNSIDSLTNAASTTSPLSNSAGSPSLIAQSITASSPPPTHHRADGGSLSSDSSSAPNSAFNSFKRSRKHKKHRSIQMFSSSDLQNLKIHAVAAQMDAKAGKGAESQSSSNAASPRSRSGVLTPLSGTSSLTSKHGPQLLSGGLQLSGSVLPINAKPAAAVSSPVALSSSPPSHTDSQFSFLHDSRSDSKVSSNAGSKDSSRSNSTARMSHRKKKKKKNKKRAASDIGIAGGAEVATYPAAQAPQPLTGAPAAAIQSPHSLQSPADHPQTLISADPTASAAVTSTSSSVSALSSTSTSTSASVSAPSFPSASDPVSSPVVHSASPPVHSSPSVKAVAQVQELVFLDENHEELQCAIVDEPAAVSPSHSVSLSASKSKSKPSHISRSRPAAEPIVFRENTEVSSSEDEFIRSDSDSDYDGKSPTAMLSMTGTGTGIGSTEIPSRRSFSSLNNSQRFESSGSISNIHTKPTVNTSDIGAQPNSAASPVSSNSASTPGSRSSSVQAQFPSDAKGSLSPSNAVRSLVSTSSSIQHSPHAQSLSVASPLSVSVPVSPAQSLHSTSPQPLPRFSPQPRGSISSKRYSISSGVPNFTPLVPFSASAGPTSPSSGDPSSSVIPSFQHQHRKSLTAGRGRRPSQLLRPVSITSSAVPQAPDLAVDSLTALGLNNPHRPQRGIAPPMRLVKGRTPDLGIGVGDGALMVKSFSAPQRPKQQGKFLIAAQNANTVKSEAPLSISAVQAVAVAPSPSQASESRRSSLLQRSAAPVKPSASLSGARAIAKADLQRKRSVTSLDARPQPINRIESSFNTESVEMGQLEIDSIEPTSNVVMKFELESPMIDGAVHDDENPEVEIVSSITQFGANQNPTGAAPSQVLSFLQDLSNATEDMIPTLPLPPLEIHKVIDEEEEEEEEEEANSATQPQIVIQVNAAEPTAVPAIDDQKQSANQPSSDVKTEDQVTAVAQAVPDAAAPQPETSASSPAQAEIPIPAAAPIDAAELAQVQKSIAEPPAAVHEPVALQPLAITVDSSNVPPAAEKPKKKKKKVYEPSDDAILQYASVLGIELPADRDLLWIAKLALQHPVPEPWKACEANGVIYFVNFATGECSFTDPSDEYYYQMYEQEKEKKIKQQIADMLRGSGWSSSGILDLSGKGIDDSAAEVLGDLINPPMGDAQAESLPRHLLSVDLSHNSLTAIGLECILYALYQRFVDSIKLLNLSNNSLNIASAELISRFLFENSTVEFVDLSFNEGIGNMGIEHLSDSLVTCTRLQTLKLSAIGINDFGLNYLSDALKQHPTLQSLDVSNNSITEAGLKNLGSTILTTARLVELTYNSPSNLILQHSETLASELQFVIDLHRQDAQERRIAQLAILSGLHNSPDSLIAKCFAPDVAQRSVTSSGLILLDPSRRVLLKSLFDFL